jgi:ABC-type multidrug transport system fused ATPase/permease subunit
MLLASEVLVPGMFVTAATWIAAHYALRRAITPGELVSFYAYTSFLTLPLATLTEVADKVVRGLVAAGRVTAILALQPDVGEPACAQPEPAPGAALRDPVSGLLVSGGELVGVAADAAADGTELADRLGRYSGRPAAAAELGGVPLDQLPTETVRRRVLVAAGDAQLFAGPVTEQLSGARAGGAATDREVLDALATASGTDILDAIPGGLRGDLDSRGRSLSGGQRQRLGLARALLADP